MFNKWQYLFFIPLFGISEPIESSLNLHYSQISSKQVIEQIAESNTKNNHCSQELELLTDSLLKEIPNYSNRIIQRTQNISQNAGISTYIIAAGQEQFEALNLPQIQYNPVAIDNTEQIFFTTLERQYISDNATTRSPNTRKIEREAYHWLFLTPTNNGWSMVTMFSRFGSSVSDNLPTPPQESSKGIIGQAVQLWLKDCRAGKTLG
ncbi:MAG: hypothetical protein AAGA80_18425 [Cyanobacteria bacterium P01_F01_bin.143]